MANIHGSEGADKSTSGYQYLSNDLRGTELADNIYGYGGNDVLLGDKGNDLLDGGAGADSMEGSLGDDTYIVDNVGDSVVDDDYTYTATTGNNAGYDIVKSYIDYTLPTNIEELQLFNSYLAIFGAGNSLSNKMTGNLFDNVLSGLGGDDTLWGLDGADQLFGGTGRDTLYGGHHHDRLYGGSENDVLLGENGNDILDGGSGSDVMRGGVGDDTYTVRETGDQVIESASQGHDTVFSNLGNYTLTTNVEDLVLEFGVINGTGNSLRNQIVGTDDTNIIKGLGDNDVLYGMGGMDTLDGGTGADTMHGGTQNDIYLVDDADDVVVENTGEGVDKVESKVSYNLTANVEKLELFGQAANGTGNSLDNQILGNAYDNTLAGGIGEDSLFGRSGRDDLRGGSGHDTLYGENDNDTLNGGVDNDTLYGGTGTDKFVFDTSLGTFKDGNVDTIGDFNAADDTIWLDNSIFTALAAVDIRTLSSSEFRLGTGAQDSSDRIIYNGATGALLYDSDGSGTAAALQFASVAPGLAITDQDFVIF